MAIRLWDIQNGKVIPTEHCFALKDLKALMDNYKKDDQYLKIYQYLFYKYCPDPEINACFHLSTEIKDEFITRQVQIDFSLDDSLIVAADETVKTLYETELSRAFNGIKTAVDNMAKVMATEIPTFGRDGSASAILQIAKNFDAVRQSYKGVYKDLMDEQKSSVRGQQRLAYDSKQ